MKVVFGADSFEALVWRRELGVIGNTFSYDTETTMVPEDSPEIPEIVLGIAFNGQTIYFIRRDDLGEFWRQHAQATVYTHTAKFDIVATTKFSGYDFGGIIAAGRLYDASILYRLLTLAKKGVMLRRGYSLDVLSQELCGVLLDKDVSIRTGFGNYLKDGAVNYAQIPVTSLEYAARDAVATFLVTAVLIEESCKIQTATFGETASLEARNLYGPLGHHIQLKGDLALEQIERIGISIDPHAVDVLGKELDVEIKKCTAVLEG